MLTNAGTPDPGNWTRQTGCSNTNTEILTSDDRWRSGSKSKLVNLVDIKRLRVWLENEGESIGGGVHIVLATLVVMPAPEGSFRGPSWACVVMSGPCPGPRKRRCTVESDFTCSSWPPPHGYIGNKGMHLLYFTAGENPRTRTHAVYHSLHPCSCAGASSAVW